MNKLFFVAALAFGVLALFFLFNGNGKDNNKKQIAATEQKENLNKNTDSASSDEMLPVDLKSSSIVWSAKKLIGETKHTGLVTLREGSFFLEKDSVVGGNFTINMDSITNSDISVAQLNQKLVAHLKSDDFFSVEKFPTARFVIKKIDPSANTTKMTGDLTIKDVTREISFDSVLAETEDEVKNSAEFSIDRTKWGVTFGSNSFFSNLKEDAIDDNIFFEINIQARRGGS